MINIRKTMQSKPWLLPTIIFSVLVILAANMHPLWGDEAETALFARNILHYGVPKGWDGTNIMGINNAVVLNNNLINHTSPWAQYYITAASFAIFGQTSFSARLPFIILSIFSIPLLYFLVLKLSQSKKAATLATIIAGVSVPYILFSYQDRYYALTSICGLLLAFSGLSITQKSIKPKIIFVIAAVLFFYGNYVSFAAFYASLFIGLLIYKALRKEGWENIKRFIVWYALLTIPILAITTPWYLLLQPFANRGQIVLSSTKSISDLYDIANEAFALYNNNNGFPKLLAAALGITAIIKWRKKESLSPIAFFFLIPGIYLVIMSLFTQVSVVDTTFIAIRYTMVAFPFFLASIAILIFEI
ncbi:MAG: hypothetical protein ACHQVK_01275, partial [Candidatus Paceibacterales bacterium]